MKPLNKEYLDALLRIPDENLTGRERYYKEKLITQMEQKGKEYRKKVLNGK